jgi:hypothetical protein
VCLIVVVLRHCVLLRVSRLVGLAKSDFVLGLQTLSE